MTISASQNHDWPDQRLDRVLAYRKRQVAPSELRGKQVFHYSIPIIAATGDGQLEDGEEIDSNKFIVTGDEILVSKLNPHKGHLIMTRPHQALAVRSTEFLPLVAREGERRFFYYLYSSQPVREEIVARCQSATRSHMRALPEDIWKITAAIPPVPTQRAIADFLDRKTRAIDELIRKKERLIELLQEKRQALITQAVTKGLPAEAAAKAGLDPNVPMKDSGVPWLGEIPARWDLKRLGHLSRVVRGASPRPAGDPRYFAGDHTPWITVGEITKDDDIYLEGTATLLTEEGRDLSRVIPADTLLLTNSGATLGVPKITRIEGCINDGSVALLDVSRATSKLYLYWYLTSLTENLRERIKQGSGQPNLNTDIVKSLPVPLPPLTEQNAILELIGKQLERVSAARAVLGQQLAKIGEYRQALISAAVTGQIDVTERVAVETDQNPSQELAAP